MACGSGKRFSGAAAGLVFAVNAAWRRMYSFSNWRRRLTGPIWTFPKLNVPPEAPKNSPQRWHSRARAAHPI